MDKERDDQNLLAVHHTDLPREGKEKANKSRETEDSTDKIIQTSKQAAIHKNYH
jgi:hypothetical protein